MDLDRHKLEEERRWRFKNYELHIRRLVSSLVDAIQTEGRRVLEHEIVYDDQRMEYSYVDQAGQLQHAILQAVNNADFGGLTRDAGELHAVEMALHTLAKMKDALPSATRLELERAEDDRLRERLASKVARLEKRDAEDREGCVASVHEGGRGVGFHRCSRRGTHTVIVGPHGDKVAADAEGAREVKVCGTHLKDAERGRLHIYRPNDALAAQNLGWRKQEEREINMMRRQLGELVEGSVVKELDAGSIIPDEIEKEG